jgi:hypothetical protein
MIKRKSNPQVTHSNLVCSCLVGFNFLFKSNGSILFETCLSSTSKSRMTPCALGPKGHSCTQGRALSVGSPCHWMFHHSFLYLAGGYALFPDRYSSSGHSGRVYFIDCAVLKAHWYHHCNASIKSYVYLHMSALDRVDFAAAKSVARLRSVHKTSPTP